MNRFVVIVLSDRREDSDAVVAAVSALGHDKEAATDAALAQLAGEREYAVAAAAEGAAARAKDEDRRGVGFLKLKAQLGPGEEKSISARQPRPFTATSFQVDADCAAHFAIVDIRYAEPGHLRPNKSVDFRANSNPVPAAVFSDEGMGGPLFDFECSNVEIVVQNTSKKARTFRARLLGFHQASGAPVPLTKPFPYDFNHRPAPAEFLAPNIPPAGGVAGPADPESGSAPPGVMPFFGPGIPTVP